MGHAHHWHHGGCHHGTYIGDGPCDCGGSDGTIYCCGYDDGTECNA